MGLCRTCYRKKWSKDTSWNQQQYNQQYYQKNKDIIKNQCIRWRKNNRDNQNKYYAKKRSDPMYRLQHNLRSRLYDELKGKIKKHKRTMELVGCSIEELKQHLESKFKEGMTWSNYGKYWVVDHIQPLCSFDLSDKNQLEKANHYTNLQPLTYTDNSKKSIKDKKKMEELTKQDIEFIEKFDEDEIDAMIEYEEPFEKSGSYTCVRCSNKVSTKGGRCASCLAKLRRAKKTPGHWQRSQTKADDALRRQKGKNGTAPGTSKGNGTRKEIVDKVQRAEKKTGQKLSPDRIDNKKGYSPKNTRAVPEKLNVGRHNVDSKKLANWKKKMKKHNLSVDALLTLIKYKDEDLYKSLDVEKFHELFIQ